MREMDVGPPLASGRNPSVWIQLSWLQRSWADSKDRIDSGLGYPSASSTVLSCITACMPVRIVCNLDKSVQVEGCRPPCTHRSSAVAPITVGILMDWVSQIQCQVSILQRLMYGLRQGFWLARRLVEVLGGLGRLAVVGCR